MFAALIPVPDYATYTFRFQLDTNIPVRKPGAQRVTIELSREQCMGLIAGLESMEARQVYWDLQAMNGMHIELGQLEDPTTIGSGEGAMPEGLSQAQLIKQYGHGDDPRAEAPTYTVLTLGSGGWFELHGFETEDFMQGYLTARTWLKAEPNAGYACLTDRNGPCALKLS